jgi:signal transduction histidine kinase
LGAYLDLLSEEWCPDDIRKASRQIQQKRSNRSEIVQDLRSPSLTESSHAHEHHVPKGGSVMRLDGLSLTDRSPYVFRFLPMFEEMQARLEERRTERKRIAQDLHDTVLQEFLGASLQLQIAVDQMPASSPVKLRLNRVVEVMGRIVEGVRLAVCGLRSSSTEGVDLAEAFARIPKDLGTGDQIEFRVLVLGPPRRLNPAVRDVVYRIGHEALVNAFRHSQATRIEVELQYTATRFRLVVRDDGCGIDPKVLHSGRDGHWGLPGMRERAERIAARFRVWSRRAAGTELELAIPARVAFEC